MDETNKNATAATELDGSFERGLEAEGIAPAVGIAPEDQPEPTPVPDADRARVADEIDKAESREEVLGLALGAASACWSHLSGAGQFDPDEVTRIQEAALSRLEALDKAAERERRAEERRKAREAKAAAAAKGGE